MFIRSLLEEAPSPSRMDSSFVVGNIIYDNENGLGATGNGSNVIYRGFVAWIKPTTFKRIVTASDRSDTVKELLPLVRAGKPIATPFVILQLEGEPEAPKSLTVTGHEGRARTDVFIELNGRDAWMPVQFHIVEVRARKLNHEFFEWLDAHGVIAERSSTVVKLNAEMYYWKDEVVKPRA